MAGAAKLDAASASGIQILIVELRVFRFVES